MCTRILPGSSRRARNGSVTYNNACPPVPNYGWLCAALDPLEPLRCSATNSKPSITALSHVQAP